MEKIKTILCKSFKVSYEFSSPYQWHGMRFGRVGACRVLDNQFSKNVEAVIHLLEQAGVEIGSNRYENNQRVIARIA